MNHHKKIKLVAVGLLFTMSVSAHANEDPLGLYQTAWDTVAKEYQLDAYELYAIAMSESEYLWSDGTVRPWPWAININKKSYYPSTKSEALELVGDRKDVDLGLLQVNSYWNGNGLTNAQLINPATNLRVAAKTLLAAKLSAPDDLELAYGRYHTWKDESRARKYGRKVISWYYKLKYSYKGRL